MKKMLSLLITVIILFGCIQVCFADNAVSDADTVIVSADTAAEIVAPAGDERLSYAADIMKKYIESITGITVPVTERSAARHRIVITRDGSLPEGAYSVKENDGVLTVSSGGKRGALYGVYAFLEKNCGCKWYTCDNFIVPKADEISVPAGYELKYERYFEYTETDWCIYRNSEFAPANGLSGGNYSHITEEMGGATRYLPGCFAHTLATNFCSADTYFEEHPEYFALHNGKRSPRQLCLSNPDVLAIVKREVLGVISTYHDPSQALQIISVSQHDFNDYCTCPECKATDKANGSHSGALIKFINSIADAVWDAGYTNIAIDTLAYQYTRQAPTQIRPRDNVLIRLCPLECCYGHAFDDPSCKENAKFMADLKEWTKISRRVYVWDYGTNFSEYINFFPNFNVMQRNLQIFKENNIAGVFMKGCTQTDECDGEFSELRLYLQAKLMQDPYLDFDAELNGFLSFYYGAGWKGIRDFIDICTEKSITAKNHITLFDRAKGSLPGIKSEDIAKLDECWKTAAAKAQTQQEKDRVSRSAFCWRYWKCANRKGEFSPLRTTLYGRMKARDELYLDLVAAGMTILGETNRERALSDCYALHLLNIPFGWTTLYDSIFWDMISPAVVALYKIAGKLYNND
ncbi:MAG: DUF4838 domain-containing protein [Clostridiales bacterium]|nr:DUF4838 domain-containing protein [Clostridiales bacterium]